MECKTGRMSSKTGSIQSLPRDEKFNPVGEYDTKVINVEIDYYTRGGINMVTTREIVNGPQEGETVVHSTNLGTVFRLRSNYRNWTQKAINEYGNAIILRKLRWLAKQELVGPIQQLYDLFMQQKKIANITSDRDYQNGIIRYEVICNKKQEKYVFYKNGYVRRMVKRHDYRTGRIKNEFIRMNPVIITDIQDYDTKGYISQLTEALFIDDLATQMIFMLPHIIKRHDLLYKG